MTLFQSQERLGLTLLHRENGQAELSDMPLSFWDLLPSGRIYQILTLSFPPEYRTRRSGAAGVSTERLKSCTFQFKVFEQNAPAPAVPCNGRFGFERFVYMPYSATKNSIVKK